MTSRFLALAVAILSTGTPSLALAADASAAMARLPKKETPGSQIGWQSDALKALTQAVERNVPLVVVFGAADSRVTEALATSVLTCPHVNQLAGLAVFTYGAPQEDEMARRMAAHLKLTDYPTISVFAPRTDTLTELYRLEGFFDASTILDDLAKVFREHGYWPKSFSLPARPVPPPYGYVGRACDPASAKRMGF